MDTLDHDSFLEIVKHMDRSEIDAMCATNKRFYSFCSQNKDWIKKFLLRRDFGIRSLTDVYDIVRTPLYSINIDGKMTAGSWSEKNTLVKATSHRDALYLWLAKRLQQPRFRSLVAVATVNISLIPFEQRRGFCSSREGTEYRVSVIEDPIRIDTASGSTTVSKNELLTYT